MKIKLTFTIVLFCIIAHGQIKRPLPTGDQYKASYDSLVKVLVNTKGVIDDLQSQINKLKANDGKQDIAVARPIVFDPLQISLFQNLTYDSMAIISSPMQKPFDTALVRKIINDSNVTNIYPLIEYCRSKLISKNYIDTSIKNSIIRAINSLPPKTDLSDIENELFDLKADIEAAILEQGNSAAQIQDLIFFKEFIESITFKKKP